MCGEYHMTLDRSEKDALLYTPNAGLTLYEQMGMARRRTASAAAAWKNWERGRSARNSEQGVRPPGEVLQAAKPPQVKFKDLEEVVSHKISVNLMPFDVRTDFVRVTSDTVLVPITIQVKNRDITFVNKDGVQRGTVNIFGRVTSLTGKVVQTFEDTVQVDVPAELLPKVTENSSVYWKALPLRPNLYRIDVAVKDVNGDRSDCGAAACQCPLSRMTVWRLLR